MNARSPLILPLLLVALLGFLPCCDGSGSSFDSSGVVERYIRQRHSDRTVSIESIDASVSGETAKVVGAYRLEQTGGFEEDVRDFAAELRKYDSGWRVEGFNSTSRFLPEGMYK